MIAAIELLAGWILLWKGGDALVDGADRFARSHGVPPTIAGVFILGFGTSFPELSTTILAIFEEKPGIALGNVIGSNIANVALILGATVLIAAVPVNRFLKRIEIPFCVAVSCIAWVVAWDEGIGKWDGAILLALFGLYALFAIWTYSHREELELEKEELPDRNKRRDLGWTLAGLVGVVLGAWLFLTGATVVADWLGLTDGVIGLTLVALGTSLPELATGIAAVRANKPDLLLGNVVGSNIFNLLLVLGVAALLEDQQPEERMFTLDFPLMVGLAVTLLVFGLFRVIPRWAGAAFLLVYFVYVFGFSGAL